MRKVHHRPAAEHAGHRITASAETLHFAPPRPPPFVTANGKSARWLRLLCAQCQQMQAQCQFTAQRFDTLIPALRFKKSDAVIAGIEVIPMREKQSPSADLSPGALRVVIVNKDVAHTFAEPLES